MIKNYEELAKCEIDTQALKPFISLFTLQKRISDDLDFRYNLSVLVDMMIWTESLRVLCLIFDLEDFILYKHDDDLRKDIFGHINGIVPIISELTSVAVITGDIAPPNKQCTNHAA